MIFKNLYNRLFVLSRNNILPAKKISILTGLAKQNIYKLQTPIINMESGQDAFSEGLVMIARTKFNTPQLAVTSLSLSFKNTSQLAMFGIFISSKIISISN